MDAEQAATILIDWLIDHQEITERAQWLDMLNRLRSLVSDWRAHRCKSVQEAQDALASGIDSHCSSLGFSSKRNEPQDSSHAMGLDWMRR